MTVCNIIIIAKIKDTIDIHTPSNIEIFNGAVVKDTKPSIAYENNFLKPVSYTHLTLPTR